MAPLNAAVHSPWWWLLAALALLGWAAAGLLWRAWRDALAQAQALEQGRLVESDEPQLPALRGLSRSLNGSVRRLRGLFAAQAEQVALLQRQAQRDAISGLSLRPHFIAQLQPRLADAGGPGVALLLVRVRDLDALNHRVGHEATDRLLAAIGDVLLTYVDRVAGTFAGRLNGSDFALYLPVSGVAQETAESLLAALAAAPALRASGAEVVVGGVDGLRALGSGAALAAADAALASAEFDPARGGGVAVEMHVSADAGAGEAGVEGAATDAAATALGARAWREQIAAALAEGRVQLAEFPVVDRDGLLVRLDCPLRVQLLRGGDYQPAQRWLALARRSRVMPLVDLAAIDLALQAITRDEQARAVHVSAASLATPAFAAQVARRLAAAPRAAARLSISCTEISGSDAPQRDATIADDGMLATASAAWRPFGVRVGIEHAGGTPQRLPAQHASGIDYVKVDVRHLNGIADDAAVRGYAQSLVALIHGLKLEAVAEGLDDPRDVAALWPLGFDAATGPAVALQAGR